MILPFIALDDAIYEIKIAPGNHLGLFLCPKLYYNYLLGKAKMLEIKNVSFKIGKKTILDHISFELSEGEFLVITGPNGSGKSTLAQIIMGIKKPTEGQILFNQQDITNLSIRELSFSLFNYNILHNYYFVNVFNKMLITK